MVQRLAGQTAKSTAFFNQRPFFLRSSGCDFFTSINQHTFCGVLGVVHVHVHVDVHVCVEVNIRGQFTTVHCTLYNAVCLLHNQIVGNVSKVVSFCSRW